MGAFLIPLAPVSNTRHLFFFYEKVSFLSLFFNFLVLNFVSVFFFFVLVSIRNLNKIIIQCWMDSKRKKETKKKTITKKKKTLFLKRAKEREAYLIFIH